MWSADRQKLPSCAPANKETQKPKEKSATTFGEVAGTDLVRQPRFYLTQLLETFATKAHSRMIMPLLAYAELTAMSQA